MAEKETETGHVRQDEHLKRLREGVGYPSAVVRKFRDIRYASYEDMKADIGGSGPSILGFVNLIALFFHEQREDILRELIFTTGNGIHQALWDFLKDEHPDECEEDLDELEEDLVD